MRWKQNTMATGNHAGMLESLCPAKHSLPPAQSTFKLDFHHLHISCILKVHKRYEWYSYCIFTPCSSCFSASIQLLLCLYPICCHSQSRVQGHLVRTYKAPFPACPYCYHHITRSCSHCVRHCRCWKPANLFLWYV